MLPQLGHLTNNRFISTSIIPLTAKSHWKQGDCRWAFAIGDKSINVCDIILRKSECRHCMSRRDIKTIGFLVIFNSSAVYARVWNWKQGTIPYMLLDNNFQHCQCTTFLSVILPLSSCFYLKFIEARSRYPDKSSYLQLWIDFSHQICRAVHLSKKSS